MFVAIFVSICKFQLCKKLFQIIVLPSFYGDNYAKEMTRVNDNESNMTNVYMSQLIVTEVQKEKHAFNGIQLYKILLCMSHALCF